MRLPGLRLPQLLAPLPLQQQPPPTTHLRPPVTMPQALLWTLLLKLQLGSDVPPSRVSLPVRKLMPPMPKGEQTGPLRTPVQGSVQGYK